MTTTTHTATDATHRIAHADDRAARTLVTGGAIAGPVFVLTAGVQSVSRDGFDLTRQPISLLSLGDAGWVQITNFILAGVLMLGFAVGAARALRGGPSRRWAPWLFGVFGTGLVIGGAFTADPALGFPVGAPEGIPETMSFHALVHAVAPPLAFTSLVIGMFVVAHRLAWEGRRRAAVWTRVAAVVCFALSVPVGPGFSVRLFLAVALGFAWITAYAVSLLRRPSIAEPGRGLRQ